MQENIKKPAIRFDGFTDAWEQRKLGSVGNTYTGLSGKTKEDFGHGEGRFITYMNVFTNPISSIHEVEPIEIDCSQNEVQVGDVFFTTSSETPEEVGMSSVLLEKQGNTYLNSFCFGYRPTTHFDPYYLAYMLRSDEVRKQIVFLAQGISRYNISKNKMMDIDIPIPSLAEQEQIGTYFKHLDDLITLHQRDKSSRTALGSVERKENANAWEQRKVYELIEDYIERTTVQNQYPVLTSSQQYGIVRQEDYFADRQVTTSDNIGYYVLPFGYFTYRSRSDTDLFVFNRNTLINKGIISYYYPVFKAKNCDSNFLLRRLNHGIRQQLAMAAEGTGQKVLAHSKFKNMVIDVPSQREQERIGLVFEQIDSLITLHQRECKYQKTEDKNVKQNQRDRPLLRILRSVDWGV